MLNWICVLNRQKWVKTLLVHICGSWPMDEALHNLSCEFYDPRDAYLLRLS